jgi:hypothetical protein
MLKRRIPSLAIVLAILLPAFIASALLPLHVVVSAETCRTRNTCYQAESCGCPTSTALAARVCCCHREQQPTPSAPSNASQPIEKLAPWNNEAISPVETNRVESVGLAVESGIVFVSAKRSVQTQLCIWRI